MNDSTFNPTDKLTPVTLASMDQDAMDAMRKELSILGSNSPVPPMASGELSRILGGLSDRDPEVMEEVRRLLTSPPSDTTLAAVEPDDGAMGALQGLSRESVYGSVAGQLSALKPINLGRSLPELDQRIRPARLPEETFNPDDSVMNPDRAGRARNGHPFHDDPSAA